MLDNYFSWSGKMGRRRFFISSIVMGIFAGAVSIAFILLLLGYITHLPPDVNVDGPAVFAGTLIWSSFIFFALYLFLISFPVVKRFHDINKTGWLYWILFLPWINIYFLLELLLQRGIGEQGESDFLDRVGRSVPAKIVLGIVIPALWSYFLIFRHSP